MFTLRSLAVALLICFAASISFSAFSQAEDEAQMKKDIKSMTGDIICVLPMDKDGNVKAVIASGDCSGHAPHVHVFREAGTANVFSIEATPEKLKELEQSNKKGVTLAGKITGSTRGWVLSVQ
jgi:hypothetical protein